jgi:hypothetical protein
VCQRADRAEGERATGLSQTAAGHNDGVYGTLLEFMGIVSESTLAGSTGYANQAGGANNQRMNLAQSWVIAAETSPPVPASAPPAETRRTPETRLSRTASQSHYLPMRSAPPVPRLRFCRRLSSIPRVSRLQGDLVLRVRSLEYRKRMSGIDSIHPLHHCERCPMVSLIELIIIRLFTRGRGPR